MTALMGSASSSAGASAVGAGGGVWTGVVAGVASCVVVGAFTLAPLDVRFCFDLGFGLFVREGSLVSDA